MLISTYTVVPKLTATVGLNWQPVSQTKVHKPTEQTLLSPHIESVWQNLQPYILKLLPLQKAAALIGKDYNPHPNKETKQYPFSLVYCTFATSLKHPTDASISNIMRPQ